MNKNLNFILTCLLTLNLVSCAKDDDDNDKKNTVLPSINAAIINTVAPDYSDADMELVDLNSGVYTGSLTAHAGDYTTVLSDYALTAYGENVYRIGKYGIDNIAKYSIKKPTTAIYTYSTLDNSSDPSSNPYQLIFVSETKAYLIRYNTNIVWIVNPSATAEANFKIGEIDLTAYDDGDGATEMSDGVIVNGKLFITLQRQNFFTVVAGNSYVAVIDTATDTEINTTGTASPALNGIHLQTNNPASIIFDKNNSLLVQSIGNYGDYSNPATFGFIGGIEKINLTDYSTSILVDDGDNTTHPYGLITHMVILSATLGYFVGYESWGDNVLHQFNPATGFVEPGLVANLGGNIAPDDIVAINNGPENSLWVSLADASNPRVLVINTANNSIVDEVETTYNPAGVVFAKVN